MGEFATSRYRSSLILDTLVELFWLLRKIVCNVTCSKLFLLCDAEISFCEIKERSMQRGCVECHL